MNRMDTDTLLKNLQGKTVIECGISKLSDSGALTGLELKFTDGTYCKVVGSVEARKLNITCDDTMVIGSDLT